MTALKEKARLQRPDLLALKQGQARSQADLRLQIAAGKVDYTVGTEYRRQDAPSGMGNSLGFFFSAPLPFFHRNQGEIARAERELTQAGARILALQASVNADVSNTWQQYLTSKRLFEDIQATMLPKAKEVRETTEYSYRRGEASLVEFLDAQRAFNDAMQSYNDARAAYARSLYLMDAMTGASVACWSGRSEEGHKLMRNLLPVFLLTFLLGGCGKRATELASTSDAAVGAKEPVPPSSQVQINTPNVVVLGPDAPELRQMTIEPVRSVPVPADEITAPAKIEANPNRVGHAVLPAPGRIVRVMVKLGDSVAQGQPVVAIESSVVAEAESGHIQSDASVRQAELAVAKAEADLARETDLFEHQAVAQKEVLAAQTTAALAKASLEQAEVRASRRGGAWSCWV